MCEMVERGFVVVAGHRARGRVVVGVVAEVVQRPT